MDEFWWNFQDMCSLGGSMRSPSGLVYENGMHKNIIDIKIPQSIILYLYNFWGYMKTNNH